MFSLNETPHKRNLHTLISTTTALLVSLLAPGALVLSYNALRGVATAYGLSGWQSYVWPLLLDFALVVFSLAVVRNALLRERTLWPWTLVGLYTAATVAFNILHAPDNPVARVVAVVAPLSLFLSFETLMAQLKSEVRRHNAIQSLTDLSTQIDQKQQKLGSLSRKQDNLTDNINRLANKLTTLKQNIRTTQKQRMQGKSTDSPVFVPGDTEKLSQARDTKQDKIQTRRDKILALLREGVTNKKDLAEHLGVSIKTINRDLRQLNGSVALAGANNGDNTGQETAK